jgi:predicted nucleic acid-binding protein
VIVIDTCIISSLAKAGRLKLLRYFTDPCTSPGVIREISSSGNPVLAKCLSEALADWLTVRTVKNPEELSSLQDRYPVLGHVDCELVLLSRELGSALLTDDSRLIEEAETRLGIETFDLCDVLMVLQKKDKIDEKQLDELIANLERKDRYKFSKESLRRLGR